MSPWFWNSTLRESFVNVMVLLVDLDAVFMLLKNLLNSFTVIILCSDWVIFSCLYVS